MRPSASDTALLSILAAMPFRDRLELVALSGRPRATLYQRVERMERAGLLESVRHANELIASTRRYCLSAQGVGQLAIAEGIPVSQLLCCTPKSEQWRRILLERLDAVAAIYRFCEATPRVAHPLGFRWYRASPIDVALTLPDGRSVALVRQGVTADRTAFAKRIRRLHDAPGATGDDGDTARADLTLPLFVSDRHTLERAGPLGSAWFSVERDGVGRAFWADGISD